jgi:hypothetical protein
MTPAERGQGEGPAPAAFTPKPRDHTDAAYITQTDTDEGIAKVMQYGGAIKNMPMMPSNPAVKGSGSVGGGGLRAIAQRS